MKKLFSPILNHFEKGEARYAYKPLHRTILNVVAVLFLVIASGSLFAAIKFSVLGALSPPWSFWRAVLSVRWWAFSEATRPWPICGKPADQ